jgi:hypothetical protein
MCSMLLATSLFDSVYSSVHTQCLMHTYSSTNRAQLLALGLWPTGLVVLLFGFFPLTVSQICGNCEQWTGRASATSAVQYSTLAK